jgi:outer membrane biosynthesis protein TonB
MVPSSLPGRVAAVAILVALTAVACGFVGPLSGTPQSLAIQRFVAVPGEVPAGTPAVLSWDVEGADSIELDNGIGMVAATGSRTVHPAATTTYRLVAVAGTSLATASIRVLVMTAPDPSSSPKPKPTPSPTSSPTPKPTPTPKPSPTPSEPPKPTPAPSPSPG